MDAIACLLKAQSHREDEETSEAIRSLRDYYAWRLMGGFAPSALPFGHINTDLWALSMMEALADSFEE